ncbi:MAG TPA: hypothetical protein VF585_08050 [Chthoniobacterales bacterium]|jgi:hypothetical protein
MSYFVTVSLDVTNSRPDTYTLIEAVMAEIGLPAKMKGSTGKMHPLPSTTYAGEFIGSSAAKVRDDLSELIKKKFSENSIKSQIFISVGGDWTWGIRYT